MSRRSLRSILGPLSFLDLQAIEETMQRLTHEVNIQTYLSKELLLPAPSRRQQEAEAGRIPGLVQEEAHFMSIQINLFNTFLYMVIYP